MTAKKEAVYLSKSDLRQCMDNKYGELKGCINRMFVSDDPDELPGLRSGAHFLVDVIYGMGMQRFDDRKEGGE